MLSRNTNAAASHVARTGARTDGHDVRPSGSRYPEHMSRLERITVDQAVCHGQPVVRGMRYPVQSLLEFLASGMTIEEVLADYPDLEREDLLAALEFGALTAGGHRVVPLGTE